MKNVNEENFHIWKRVGNGPELVQDMTWIKTKFLIVELFFGVKVIVMNNHRLPGKGRRMGPIMGHTIHYRRMIITFQPGYSIPPLIKKRT